MSVPPCPSLESFFSETSITDDTSETFSMANTLVEEEDEEEPLQDRKQRWDAVQDHMAAFSQWARSEGAGSVQGDIKSRLTLMREIDRTLRKKQEGITQKQKEWIDQQLLGLHKFKYWKLTYHVVGEEPLIRCGEMLKHYYCFDHVNCLQKHQARIQEEFGGYLQDRGKVMAAEKVEWEEQ